jgi:lipoprotein-releasing system permease protein
MRQTLICIAGVTISVMMFIGMTAMMSGFSDKFIIETVEATGHITIQDEPRQADTPILQLHYKDPAAVLKLEGPKPRDTAEKIKNATGLILQLETMPGIVAAAPVVSGDAIASYGTKTANVAISGIDPRRYLRVTTIGKNVTEGSFDRLDTTADGIILGSGVAQLLGARLDDNLLLSSPTGGRTNAKVVGIFSTGVTPVDYTRAYMLQSAAQTLLDK